MSNPFDYFDEIYCINLDERKDRWENVQKEFEKAGILDRVQRFSAIRTEDGRLGASQSNIEIIKIAKRKNLKNVLVFEDDIKFIVDNPQEILEKSISQVGNIPWNLFYLGANTHEKLIRIKPNLILLKKAFAIQSMSYSNKVYDTLINKFDGLRKINNYNDILDVFLAQVIQEKYICLMCNPMLTTQINSYSDIEKRYVDYSFIEDRFKKNIS